MNINRRASRASASAGAARSALFTLAVISALYVLNLVPHRAEYNPITRGLPSDGMQALRLLRKRPLPPPMSARPCQPTGLRAPLSGYQIVMTLARVPLWILVSANHLNRVALCAWLPLVLQGTLGGGSLRSNSPAKTATPASSPRAVTRLRAPMKTCPKCGAEVRAAARLCFCYYSFEGV